MIPTVTLHEVDSSHSEEDIMTPTVILHEVKSSSDYSNE